MGVSRESSLITVPRMCWVMAAYELAWGVAMLSLGAQLLASELGEVFAPEVLVDNPVLNGYVRLLGTTLLGLAAVCAALSRVRDPGAQAWIRRAWLIFWSVELVVDGLCMQLPALIGGEPQATVAGVVVPLVFRAVFVLGWALASPSGPRT